MTTNIEKRVIEKVKEIPVEKLYKTLWEKKVIGSQGPWGLDYLRNRGRISAKAQEFVNKHWEKETDVDDFLRQEFMIEVWAYDQKVYAKQEFGKEIDELTEEELEEAFEYSSEDINYFGYAGLLGVLYDDVMIDIEIENNPDTPSYEITVKHLKENLNGH